VLNQLSDEKSLSACIALGRQPPLLGTAHRYVMLFHFLYHSLYCHQLFA